MEIDDYIVASDAQLVELASAGDQQAFEYLFTRYRDALTRLFEQRLGDRDIASDLLQETFIKVYLNIDRYDIGYTFGQWVYTIARNTLIDFTRKTRSDLPIDERFSSPAATAPTPEESIINSQQRTQIEHYLEQLPEQYNTLFKLRFLDEYSYEEIAEKLGRPLNTIKTQIRRARATICKMIIDKE